MIYSVSRFWSPIAIFTHSQRDRRPLHSQHDRRPLHSQHDRRPLLRFLPIRYVRQLDSPIRKQRGTPDEHMSSTTEHATHTFENMMRTFENGCLAEFLAASKKSAILAASKKSEFLAASKKSAILVASLVASMGAKETAMVVETAAQQFLQ